MDLLQWFTKFLIKGKDTKTATDSTATSKSNYKLTSELQKPIVRKLKRT